MKKIIVFILVLLILIVSAIFLMRPTAESSDSSETSGNEGAVSPPAEEGSQSKADEARSLLGIDLPDNATVSLILDNDLAVAVQGQTDLSIEDARAFFAAEMSSADYRVAREWGLSPADNATLQSASYSGNGENWAFILRAYSRYSTFDIQRQY